MLHHAGDETHKQGIHPDFKTRGGGVEGSPEVQIRAINGPQTWPLSSNFAFKNLEQDVQFLHVRRLEIE